MKTKSKGQTTVEVVLGAIVKDSRIKCMGRQGTQDICETDNKIMSLCMASVSNGGCFSNR